VKVEAELERKRSKREESYQNCNHCYKMMMMTQHDHEGHLVCAPCARELDSHKLTARCLGCHKMEAIYAASEDDELTEPTVNQRVWCTKYAVTKGIVFAATSSVSQIACGALCKLSQELGGTAGAAIENTHGHVYNDANGDTQVLRQEAKDLVAGSSCVVPARRGRRRCKNHLRVPWPPVAWLFAAPGSDRCSAGSIRSSAPAKPRNPSCTRRQWTA
jgi:hypothetical protein